MKGHFEGFGTQWPWPVGGKTAQSKHRCALCTGKKKRELFWRQNQPGNLDMSMSPQLCGLANSDIDS